MASTVVGLVTGAARTVAYPASRIYQVTPGARARAAAPARLKLAANSNLLRRPRLDYPCWRQEYNELNVATLTGAIDVIVVRQPDGSLKVSLLPLVGPQRRCRAKDLTTPSRSSPPRSTSASASSRS